MPGQLWEVVGGGDKGGIIVRSGAATKSPELPERLSTGAVVRQLEMQADRLRYVRLTGSGPKCGWVSTKLKDKPLLTKTDKELAAAGSAPGSNREFCIVVYGATGYTGGLISEHLDACLTQSGVAKLAWAVAGRNEAKLKELSGRLASQPQVVVADSEEQVADMAGRCRVLLNAAGPYALVGEPVVRACVAQGTDYVDITGETFWVRQMIDKYHDMAKDKGVVLVNMCGQDSVPPDVSVNLLAQHLGPLKQVRSYMLQAGAMSGGTQLTGIISWNMNAQAAFAAQQDPFHLGGERKGGPRPVDADCAEPENDPLFPKLWLGPCGTGVPDSRCVRRSCGLFDAVQEDVRYGSDFSFVYRDAAPSKARAREMIQACGPLPAPEFAPKVAEMMLDAVKQGNAPAPGAGAPEDTRKHYYSQIISIGEGENGRWAYCDHYAPESYEVTAICSVAAALTIFEERDALTSMGRAGLLTPAFGLHGTSFVERLRSNPFAHKSAKTMDWQVKDGQPTPEYMSECLTKRSKSMAEVFSKFREGELKAF